MPLNGRSARAGSGPGSDATDAFDDPVGYFTATAERAQQFFTHLLDRTGLGLVITEDGQKIRYVNRAFELLLGYPRGGLDGATVDEITHPDDLRITREARRTVSQRRSFSTRVEKRYLRRDGESVWCALTFSPFGGGARGPRLTVVQIEDISRQKTAEEALRRSEEQFRRYFDDVRIGMAVLGPDGRFERVNQAMTKFLGRGRRHLVRRPTAEFLHADDVPVFEKALRRARRGGGPQPCEARFVHGRGHEVWGDISFAVLRDENGGERHTILSIQDTTKRKTTELALRDSEERFRRSFEDSAIGMHIADRPGNIVLANRAFARMLGYSVAQLRRMNVGDLAHPDDRDRQLSLRNKMISKGLRDPDIREVRYVRADGGIMWGALSRTPITDAEGKVTFTLAQIQDVTERRLAEELLRRHNEILREVAGGAPLDSVLALIARSVEEVCPGARCSIMLVDADGLRLRVGAGPSLPKSFLKLTDGIEIGSGRGACAAAAHTGKQALTRDVATDSATQPFHAAAKRAGLGACWSTPIRSAANSVVGTFAIYLGEARKPSREERDVVLAAAPIAGIAIERSLDIEALHERERRLQHYAESAADTFWETDAEHRFQYVSPTQLNASEMADSTMNIVGVTPWEWAAADPDTDPHWRERRRAMESHKPFRNFRFSRTNSMGEKRYLRVNGTPFFDGDGNFRGYRGTTIDETAEVEARQRGRDAEQKFLNAMEGLNEGFILWDANQCFVACNGHYRAINDAVEDLLVPGTRFADFMRARAERGLVVVPDGDVDRWVGKYVAEHGVPGYTAHDSLINGRWYRVSKQSLDDGSTIVFHTDIHEMREREAAIAESEAKYRGLFERASDSIFLIDYETGQYVDANQRAAERLGYTRDELLQLGVWDVSVEADEAAFQSLKERIVRDGVGAFERTHRRKDGSLMSVEATAHVISVDGREVFQVFVRDITLRKQAEAALRQSEERFRDFANSAADRFWETDEEHRFVYLSESREGSNLVPAERLLGHIRWEMPKTGRQVMVSWEPYRRMIEARKPFRDFRFTSADADGKEFYFKTSGAPFYDEGGNFRGYRGTTVDETAVVREQRKIADIQKRFLDAMQSIDEGVALWGPDDRLVMCNDYYRQINKPVADLLRPGVRFEDVMRSIAERRVYADDVRSADQFVADATKRHHSDYSEIERFNGKEWVRMRKQKLADGSTLAFHSDVTDAKSREEAMRQAQKMEAVGQLTGGIAHDFNNLLAAILGNLEVLANNLAADPDNAYRARRAINSVQRGAQLTSRLLAFSRKQTLEPKSTNLNSLLIGMLDLLQRSLGETITIHMRPATGLWSTLIDQVQLENAVLNLAINARDAMPGGGELTFATANTVVDEAYRALHPYADTGEYVALTVSDTGAGIPDDVIEHVFEPFFTTKGVGEGSGLGLSMVFGFVKQSQGHVEIDSREGRGTSVTLYLPRAETISDDENTVPDSSIARIGSGQRILVVEDDEEVLEITMTMLSDLGFEPIAAGTGEEALAKIHADGTIEMMLCDVILPGGRSGIEVADEVARTEPGTRILLMSGFAERPGFGGGGDVSNIAHPILDKPFTLRALRAAVASTLELGAA